MLEELRDEMRLRGFSHESIKSYNWHISNFLKSNLTKRQYLFSIIDKSSASVRLSAAAIFFYEKFVLHKKPEFISLPKKQSKLPSILSKQQILDLINSTTNEKHKIIVELLYSSGLRLQELVNLKYEDFDFENKLIHVKQGKGQKDRITLISKSVLDRLDNQGNGLVLKGRKGKYSKKSVQAVLQTLTMKSKIRHKVTPHLLEQGTDLRYIQALLGHKRLETTQIYTRVAKHKLCNIKNPWTESCLHKPPPKPLKT